MNSHSYKTIIALAFFSASAMYAGTAGAQCASVESLTPGFEMSEQSWHQDEIRMQKIDWDERGDAIVGFWRATTQQFDIVGYPLVQIKGIVKGTRIGIHDLE